MQKLWSTSNDAAVFTAKTILLSKRFPKILHRLFKIPKAHSTDTLVAVSSLLKAFQQDRNPLIQLNQDNIENTEKRRTMPPTLPTENATIQQKNIPNSKQTNSQFPD